MTCKNCGADLKPGVKYCLECGNYIDEEEEYSDDLQFDSDDESIEFDDPEPVKNKKKLNLSTIDYIIYGVLFSIMIISIIVIIITLAKGNTKETTVPVTPQPSTVVEREDQTVSIDNYTVIIPGKLYSTVQESFLYVTDNSNYKFSFQNKEEEFEKYYDDQDLLKKQLTVSKYDVNSVFEKSNNGRLFLLYDIGADGTNKVLYLTKIDDKHTIFGTIEVFDNGKWENALPDIDTICNSLKMNN